MDEWLEGRIDPVRNARNGRVELPVSVGRQKESGCVGDGSVFTFQYLRSGVEGEGREGKLPGKLISGWWWWGEEENNGLLLHGGRHRVGKRRS